MVDAEDISCDIAVRVMLEKGADVGVLKDKILERRFWTPTSSEVPSNTSPINALSASIHNEPRYAKYLHRTAL
jgi:hypothetical protein